MAFGLRHSPLPSFPPVSIALATYNGAKYLRTQLDSLAQQTVLPAELVVGDDGSTDATFNILDDFARTVSFPVRVQRNPVNLGYTGNFLAAASRCTSPLIAFCDQDDFWEPRKIELCVREFADERVTLVVHDGWSTDGDLKSTGVPTQPTLTHRMRLRHVTAHTQMTLHGMRMVFRRRLIADVPWDVRPIPYDNTDKTDPMAHDRWIPFLASFMGETVLIPDKLILYRQHGNNAFGIGAGMGSSNSLSNKLNLVSATNDTVYAKWARLAYGCADFLRELPARVPASVVAEVREGEAFFRRLGDAQAARAKLYATPSRFARAPQLCGMLFTGRYASRDNGGLGLKSFAKDCSKLIR